MRRSTSVPLSLNAERRNLAESLAGKARDGDGTALEGLMDLYRHPALSLARRSGAIGEDPEELASEILSALCSGFQRWQGRAAFHTWACQVARHVVRRHCSRERRRTLDTGPEWDGDGASAIAIWPGRLANSPSELSEAMTEAIHGLPAQEREIMLLRQSGHLTREIAEIKGLAPGTVRAVVSHAYEKLRRTLRE